MSKLRKIVYLSDAQYETLLNNGSITSNGQTVVYSSDDLYITPSSSGSGGGTFYAVCNSAFSVSAKVAILTNPDGFELHEGTMVVVKFAAIAPTGQITLQIAKDDNGVTTNLTNAYPLKMYGTTNIEGGAEPMAILGWAAGAVVPFIFDGANWVRFYWNNTTYSSQAAAQNGTTNSLVTTGEKYTWNNKVDRAGDTMTGALTLSSGNISISNGSLLAGSSTRTTETQISASSIAGQIYLYAASTDGGNRGIYLPAHGTGSAKAAMIVDTNNNVTLNGNATTATKATQDGSGNVITSTYVKKAGDTMSGQLHIDMATDAGGETAPGTNVPLVIGAKDGQHIEMDNNEILSKSDGTTPTTLYLQDGAGTVSVAGTGGLNVSAGLLKVTKNSNTVSIGSQNANFCHIYNNTSIPFIFNNSILTSNGGNLGSSAYPFTNIYMGATGQISRAGSSGSWWQGRDKAIVCKTSYTGYDAIISGKTTDGSWEIGPYSNNYLHFAYVPDTSYSGSTNTGTVTSIKMGPTGTVYGAVWNDYAEYRKDNLEESQLQKPGRCVREVGDGALTLTTKRLERGCEIISDTFGFAIGQDEENGYNTPIASNGRVLAYPFESIEIFKTHIGWPVCSGPNGTVSIMTEEEEERYPGRIIGTISEIPNYEEWGTGKVKVNGRVWIRIK